MIQVSELRIGNLVYWNEPLKKGVPHRIVSIFDNGKIHTIPISLGESLHQYEGILFTDDILKSAGFTKHKVDRDSFWELKITDTCKFLYADGVVSLGVLGVSQYEWLPLKITYLHQLQNIYFALTGTELTINL